MLQDINAQEERTRVDSTPTLLKCVIVRVLVLRTSTAHNGSLLFLPHSSSGVRSTMTCDYSTLLNDVCNDVLSRVTVKLRQPTPLQQRAREEDSSARAALLGS